MSYTRPCNKCGQRISLRQMPAGQWVAFDVSTEESHVCGVQNEPSVSVKLKKNKKKVDDETEDFGIKVDYLDDELDKEQYENLENDDEVKTYDTISGIHKCIDKAIKDKKRIFIEYNSEHNEEFTEREISPFKKFKEKGRTYLQAYCHERKNERIFLTKSIASASEVNKPRTKIKLGKPNLKILKEDQIETDLDKILKKQEREEKRQEAKEHNDWLKETRRYEREEKLREKKDSDNFPWVPAIIGLITIALLKGLGII